ncbi:MAG: nucleotide pyrophosphatase/phosphodiesterase family protein [Planctomycetota bacterium]
MSRRVLVLNVVGLTPRLLQHAPRLRALGPPAPLTPPLPAVTSTCEATMLTGLPPSEHGVVANGWYHRDLNEVWFWRHSNRLMQGEKVWQAFDGRSAVLFWRFNMAIDAAVTVAERPAYPADGRKIPDLYTQPPALGRELQEKLGRFPLFHFWGPTASIASTKWIADSAIEVMAREDPDLTMVYLPHLDYDLQRWGPDDPRIPAEVAAVDAEAARVLDAAGDRTVLVVSEYHIEKATGPVMLNRALREAGLLEVIDNPVGELLDTWRSRAFAVCDHQLAHVYVKDAADLAATRAAIEKLDGFDRFVEIPHARSGELIALAQRGRWFAYPYWLDDARAPDFARTVDIHRKPGYDPCELFFDPKVTKPGLAWRLLRKTIGLRTLFDVVPLAPEMVGGTHGRLPDDPEDGPVLLGAGDDRPRDMAAIKQEMLRALREPSARPGT